MKKLSVFASSFALALQSQRRLLEVVAAWDRLICPFLASAATPGTNSLGTALSSSGTYGC